MATSFGEISDKTRQALKHRKDESGRKFKAFKTTIKQPDDRKDCCLRSFGTYKLPSLEHPEGLSATHTIPIIPFSFCIECGEQIRPIKDCCVKAARYGQKYCPECGDYLFKFFVIETQGGSE